MRVFISQPMQGKSDEEIVIERNRALDILHGMYGNDIKVIDSFIMNKPITKNPLKLLGLSLVAMSEADLVVFLKGWSKSRGCKIEYDCATQYGINVLLLC